MNNKSMSVEARQASFCVPKASFCVPKQEVQQARPSVAIQLENLALALGAEGESAH